jgi:hypothetical protein
MKTTDVDALARMLDGSSPNGEAPEEARALAALAEAISVRATVTPRPEFRAELRSRLLAEAAAPPAPSWMARMRATADDALARWKYSMRLATASAMAAMTLSTGGVAAAATMSVPGDPFYPLKIAVEDARLARADSEVRRGTLLLDFAENRVAEAERAAAAERMEAAAEALMSADGYARRGAGEVIDAFLHSGDFDDLSVLSAFTAELRPRLDTLRGQVVAPATGALDDLVVSLGRIDARVEALIAG